MGIIGTILIGLIVGLVARMLKPGKDALGWIMTIVLGSIGLLTYFVVRELKARGQPAGPPLTLGRASSSA